jgi:aldose sugar dehydrogenase
VIFATGFGAITDLDVGTDGYLYILSFKGTMATISRIVPK